MSDVRSRTGVPTTEDFRSSTGTPFVINSTTGKGYVLKDDGSIVEIGAAASTVWGAITGTLSDQTDLNTALAGKASTTHATSHKSGGSDAIKLDELAAPTDVATLNSTLTEHGLLPKLGGGTTNYLRADGTWATPAAVVADGDKGDITVSASGATWTIDAAAVTLAKMADIASSRILGRATVGVGVPEELTGAQARLIAGAAALSHATQHKSGGFDAIALDELGTPADTVTLDSTTTEHGLLPKLDGLTTTFLRGDGAWAAPVAAAGDFDSVLTTTSTISANKVRTIGGPYQINDGGGVLIIADGGRLALV